MSKKERLLFSVADHPTPKVEMGGVAYTLNSRDYKAPQAVVLNDQGGQQMNISEDVTATQRSQEHGHQPIVFEPGIMSRVGGHIYDDGVAGTVRANAGDNHQAVCLENHPQDSRVKIKEDGIVQTLSSQMGMGGGNVPMVMEEQQEMVVRRLTPLECERLQGFPDHWTNIGEWVDSKGKKHKDADAPRYKALGNSIALPFWEWMAVRMVDQLRKDGAERPTMASLFDGIGGFPLAYQRAGADPIWASEIDEFPIAVTKIRFPEKGENADE